MKSLGTLAVFAVGSLCTIGVQQVYKNPEVRDSINSARDFIRSLTSKETEKSAIDLPSVDLRTVYDTDIEITAQVVKEVMNG
jgi:hypothetical protein